jgi:hypothetical protein
LIHTIGNDTQRIGVKRHVREKNENTLIFVNSKIFRSSENHIRNEQTLYRRLFCGVHKTNNSIQCTGTFKRFFEIQIVVVTHAHSAKYNSINFCTQCNHCHHFVVRLIRVCKKRNFLPRNQSIVQVNSCDSCGNKLRRLFSAKRIHRRTADFTLFAIHLRTTVNRLSVSIEKTSGKIVAHIQRRRFAQKRYFRSSADAFCSRKHLQHNLVAVDFHHLRQAVANHGEFIVHHVFRLDGNGGFGYTF